jgi:hypothetical protein
MIGNFRFPASSSSGSSSSSYTRPSDWLALPSVVAGDQKAVLLHAVFDNESNFCALRCWANYTVDWGDGVVTNHNSNTIAYHTFSYSNHAGTECSRGYRQSIVTITPQSGQNLTQLNLNIVHNTVVLGTTAWLDIKVASANMTNIWISGNTIPAKYLEIFEYVGINACADLAAFAQGASALRWIKALYANVSTNNQLMFDGCLNIEEIPLLVTNTMTNANSMFAGCARLRELPLLNMSSVTTATSMLQGTTSLKTIPLLNMSLCQNFTSFLANSGVKEHPVLNTVSATNMNNMYQGSQIEIIPAMNASNVTTATFFASACSNLKKCPVLDTSKLTTFNQFVYNTICLVEMPAFNAILCTTFPNFGNYCYSMRRFLVYNIKYSIAINNGALSKTALQEVFTNLLSNTGQTITITANYGADTPVSKTSCGTTAGSAVITQSNTASLAVGMLVLGTGISTAIAVTFQDSGDTVTLNSHGLVDGKIVSFPSITTTTGIVINKPYYVVGATANTFQVSLTLGGSAIVLTTDGTGTVTYGSYIQSIVTNTSFTVDKPASATGTVTLTNRILDTSIATLKGWTVTG